MFSLNKSNVKETTSLLLRDCDNWYAESKSKTLIVDHY